MTYESGIFFRMTKYVEFCLLVCLIFTGYTQIPCKFEFRKKICTLSEMLFLLADSSFLNKKVIVHMKKNYLYLCILWFTYQKCPNLLFFWSTPQMGLPLERLR